MNPEAVGFLPPPTRLPIPMPATPEPEAEAPPRAKLPHETLTYRRTEHWYLTAFAEATEAWRSATFDRILGSVRAHPYSPPRAEELHWYLACTEEEFSELFAGLGWQAGWVDERWWHWVGTVYQPDSTKAHRIFNAALRLLFRAWMSCVEYMRSARVEAEFRRRLESAGNPEHECDRIQKAARGVFDREVGKFASRLMTDAGQSAVQRLVRTRLTNAGDEFDAKPRWLVSDSGVLDLDQVVETGVVGAELAHDPSRLVGRRLGPGVALDRTAEAPQWRGFLERALPAEDVRWWLQRALGSALLGRPVDKLLVNLLGPRNSGKSLVLWVMRRVFGSYAWVAAAETLLKGGSTFDLNGLRGARLVTMSETPEGARFNDAVVKQLTGGLDETNSRGLYQTGSVWTPECLLVVASNHPVRFDIGDEALLKRLMLVPFEVVIPDAEIDKQFGVRMYRAEGAGILAWLLDGMEGYLTDGLADVPPLMIEARNQMAEVLSTPLQFMRWAVEDAMLVVANREGRPAYQTVAVHDLYLCYLGWCDGVGGVDKPVGRNTFGNQIRGPFPVVRSDGLRVPGLLLSDRWPSRSAWATGSGRLDASWSS